MHGMLKCYIFSAHRHLQALQKRRGSHCSGTHPVNSGDLSLQKVY